MAVFKCKMCGGDLEILDNATVCECEYCGTKQTVPTADNEKKYTLFNRANKLRLNNEFDKAAGIYESIVSEFPEEAESYWGLVLCKYGIEYVDDKKTAKKIPTCHRTVPSTVLEDENFIKAIECADTKAKTVYKAEAKVIDKLQKQILKIVEAEEPYDVFICYKETDSNGQRTEDSAIAQDIYTELVKEGYRVFFSRVTLRDKAGTDYEPYIYSALNSAKVMLAIGTKEEYYDAVWVKNEWGRYLSMMADDKSKHLIPCYKDIDAYDIPNEFKNLQALNMAEVTFFKSLFANIKKFVEKTTRKEESANINPASVTVDSLLKRAFMFLEDGNFDSASEYSEKILDIDPENALGYLVCLLVELKCKTKEELANCKNPFNKSVNYQKVVRFGDEALVNELNGYIKSINARNVETYYNQVVSAIPNATKKEDFEKIITALEKIETYKDSKEQIVFCKSKVEEILKEEENARLEAERKAEEERKDAERKVEEERIAKEKAKKKRKKLAIGIPSGVVAIALAIVLLITGIIPKMKFSNIVAVSAGTKHTLGLKSDGTVVAVGSNKHGQCDVSNWCDVIEISAGDVHSVGLKNDGTVVATGSNAYGRCNVSKWTNIVAIDVGNYHTVGLKSDGTVVAVGNNDYGQCDVKSWTDIVAVSASKYLTIGLRSNGKVITTDMSDFCFMNGECDVSEWTDIVAVSVGSDHIVGLKSNGKVVAVGDKDNRQCEVSDWSDIISISAGDYYTIGLKSDGTVVAAGHNAFGQCSVLNWNDIVAIDAGHYHTVGLKSDGTVDAVGYIWEGQCLVG